MTAEEHVDEAMARHDHAPGPANNAHSFNRHTGLLTYPAKEASGGARPPPFAEPERWNQVQRDSFEQSIKGSVQDSVPPQRMLQLAVRAAEALRPPEAADEPVAGADQRSDRKDPAASANQPLARGRPRPPRTIRKISKIPRILNALQSVQSVQNCIQRASNVTSLGTQGTESSALAGYLPNAISKRNRGGRNSREIPSDTPLDLKAEFPRAFKEVAKARARISGAQEDLDTERRLAKLPHRKTLNQIFDRQQFKLYLLIQTETAPQRPSPAAIYQHYTDLYRSRVTDEVNEQFRTPDITEQGVRIWTPPAEVKYHRRDLLLGGDRIRPPLRLPGDQINKGTLEWLLWMGGIPRTTLNPTLRKSEADIQASEAQALREEVHRLTKACEDQEAPALRAYLTRFRQSDDIFPDRNKDEEKRLRT
eukprot:g66884.t1